MWSSLKREIRIGVRQSSDLVNSLFFFLMVLSLFPLGVGPGADTLRLIAPGVIWVAALLSTLVAMESLFRNDFDNGAIEQMAMSERPLALVVLGKILGQWCLSGFMLVLLSPVVGVTYSLNGAEILATAVALALGTPTLALVGAIAAALTVGSRGAGVVLAILALPLYIPVLIIGTSMIAAAEAGLPVTGYALWLAALLMLALAFAPIATAAALRVSLSH